MACNLIIEQSFTQYIQPDIPIKRTNGYGPIGHFKWDRTWSNYRFHPQEDYSLSEEDLKDIIHLMRKVK